jgi:hypothetical protein
LTTDYEIRPSVETVEQVRVRVLPDGRLSRQDAARYLGMAEKTLAMWTLTGRGPKWLKVGGRVFYFKTDLDAFIRGVAAQHLHPHRLRDDDRISANGSERRARTTEG